MYDLGMLNNALAQSSAIIARAGMSIPGFDAPVPFTYELNKLRSNQIQLENLMQEAKRQGQSLGGITLIVGGAVLGVTAIGGWIYKHFTDAKKLETQTGIYQDLRNEGTDSERAAQIVFGGGVDFSSLMNKLIILSLIGAGIYLAVKLIK